jgi:hypothetical protein
MMNNMVFLLKLNMPETECAGLVKKSIHVDTVGRCGNERNSIFLIRPPRAGSVDRASLCAAINRGDGDANRNVSIRVRELTEQKALRH